MSALRVPSVRRTVSAGRHSQRGMRRGTGTGAAVFRTRQVGIFPPAPWRVVAGRQKWPRLARTGRGPGPAARRGVGDGEVGPSVLAGLEDEGDGRHLPSPPSHAMQVACQAGTAVDGKGTVDAPVDFIVAQGRAAGAARRACPRGPGAPNNAEKRRGVGRRRFAGPRGPVAVSKRRRVGLGDAAEAVQVEGAGRPLSALLLKLPALDLHALSHRAVASDGTPTLSLADRAWSGRSSGPPFACCGHLVTPSLPFDLRARHRRPIWSSGTGSPQPPIRPGMSPRSLSRWMWRVLACVSRAMSGIVYAAFAAGISGPGVVSVSFTGIAPKVLRDCSRAAACVDTLRTNRQPRNIPGRQFVDGFAGRGGLQLSRENRSSRKRNGIGQQSQTGSVLLFVAPPGMASSWPLMAGQSHFSTSRVSSFFRPASAHLLQRNLYRPSGVSQPRCTRRVDALLDGYVRGLGILADCSSLTVAWLLDSLLSPVPLWSACSGQREA